jgi:GTPase SAR1 family protein
MNARYRRPLKVLILGGHGTGKTSYLTTLFENRFPPENTYIPGIAYSFTLDLVVPDVSALEDLSAWRVCLDSDERTAGDAGNAEETAQSAKRGVTIAPWDVVTGPDPNDRLRPLAYADAYAVALCFSVVDRGSFHGIKDQV